MKRFISILLCGLLLSIPVFAKNKSKKPVKKQIKKIENKKPPIPEVTEFQVVEDFTKFPDFIDETRYCNVSRGIHMRFLVQAPHRALFFVCGSLEPFKQTKNEYIPNIEDPYTIHWLPVPRRRIHFDEMGGFGGEQSEIEVFKDKILIHVSIPWNNKLAPLYTREISCDEKKCDYKKLTCDFKVRSIDQTLLPEFNQFLETIAEPKNRKSQTWDDVWTIYMGKMLFQALSANPDAQSFIKRYPQKTSYPADGVFAETLMAVKDDLDLAKKAGCGQ